MAETKTTVNNVIEFTIYRAVSVSALSNYSLNWEISFLGE